MPACGVGCVPGELGHAWGDGGSPVDRHVTHDAGEPRFFLIIERPAPDLSHMGTPGKNFLIRVLGVPRRVRRWPEALFTYIWLRRPICSSSSGMCEEACVHPSPKPSRFFLIIGHVLDSCVTVLPDFLHRHQIFLGVSDINSRSTALMVVCNSLL